MPASSYSSLVTVYSGLILTFVNSLNDELPSVAEGLLASAQASRLVVIGILVPLLGAALLFGIVVSYSLTVPYQQQILARAAMEVELSETRRVAARAVHSAEQIREDLSNARTQVEYLKDQVSQHEGTVAENRDSITNMTDDLQMTLKGLISHVQTAPDPLRWAVPMTVQLARQVRDYSTNGYQDIELDVKSVNPSEILSWLTQLQAEEAKSKNVELINSDSGSLRLVMVDKTQLFLALQRVLQLQMLKLQPTSISCSAEQQTPLQRAALVIAAQTSVTLGAGEFEQSYDMLHIQRTIALMGGETQVRVQRGTVAVSVSLPWAQ
eukprot:TRINITY_DN8435_c0_g1_i1.p1 TRINITY_DN8435_c0_g1~~TRINITY_DN8435_c0_g1_i1.p1  ORF type:complete len:324 (-),score=85.14 TRINITY_DN8435_c0_g1_i1:683-1654(-)